MKAVHTRILHLLVPLFLVIASPQAMAKDKVVLSLQENPAIEEGLEPACIVLQLGSGLLMSGKAQVTVFATLDGVYIADAATYGYNPEDLVASPVDAPECDTLVPGAGLGKASLEELLIGFLSLGGQVLLCPLCDAVRQPYAPITDVIGFDTEIFAASPIPLLLEAKKVIDY